MRPGGKTAHRRHPAARQPSVLSNLQSLLLHGAPTVPLFTQTVRGPLRASQLLPRPAGPCSWPATNGHPSPTAPRPAAAPPAAAAQSLDADTPSSTSTYFKLQDLW